MKQVILALLLALPLSSQQLSNTGPVNVTPNSATVNQTFAAGGSPVAALGFSVPPEANLPIAGALPAGKVLVCNNAPPVGQPRKCMIYSLDDTSLSSGILSLFTVNVSGTLALTGLQGTNLAGTTDVPVSTGAPLVVTIPFSRCDINRDRALSQADVDLLADYYVGNKPIPAGVEVDINRNGTFNQGDVQFESRVVKGQATCPE